MVRNLEGTHASSTIEGIRQVVENCRPDGKKRYRMFPSGSNEQVWIQAVRDATVGGEDALQPSVSLLWMKAEGSLGHM